MEIEYQAFKTVWIIFSVSLFSMIFGPIISVALFKKINSSLHPCYYIIEEEIQRDKKSLKSKCVSFFTTCNQKMKCNCDCLNKIKCCKSSCLDNCNLCDSDCFQKIKCCSCNGFDMKLCNSNCCVANTTELSLERGAGGALELQEFGVSEKRAERETDSLLLPAPSDLKT